MTAVLVFENNKTAAMLVFQTNPLGKKNKKNKEMIVPVNAIYAIA